MNYTARMAGHYRLRLGIFVFAMLVMAGWCVYDGAIAWPRKAVIAQSYQDWRADGREEAWHDHAKAEWGWVKGDPGMPKQRADFIFQFVMAGGFGIGAILLGFAYVRSYSRWVAVDDEGLSANGVEKIPFSAISKIDKLKWKSKGIAFVHYDTGSRQGKILLDDWKFDLHPTRAIMVVLEEHLTDSQIILPPDANPSANAEFADTAPVPGDEADVEKAKS
jgi:hypothetical protein